MLIGCLVLHFHTARDHDEDRRLFGYLVRAWFILINIRKNVFRAAPSCFRVEYLSFVFFSVDRLALRTHRFGFDSGQGNVPLCDK